MGSVTQYVGAATALSSNLSELLGALEMLRQNTEFLRTTYEFLDIPNAMYQGSRRTGIIRWNSGMFPSSTPGRKPGPCGT